MLRLRLVLKISYSFIKLRLKLLIVTTTDKNIGMELNIIKDSTWVQCTKKKYIYIIFFPFKINNCQELLLKISITTIL